MQCCGSRWASQRVRLPRASLPRSCCCYSPSWSSCRKKTTGVGSWGQAGQGIAVSVVPSCAHPHTPPRLENGREDDHLRCMELEREVAELQQRNQALTSLAQEAQTLKDEMDELR